MGYSAALLVQKLGQIHNGFPVALQAMALDGFAAGHTGVGNLPEGLPGIHIGDMHLHSRKGNGLQSIQNGHRSMGIGGRIDHNAVCLAVGPLNFVHQISLVVALVLLHFNAQLLGGLLQQMQKIGKAAAAVDPRLPDPQHI